MVPQARSTSVDSLGRPDVILAVFLILAGCAGWIASFALTLEKFAVLENPQADLSCDFSFLVQCGANLRSPQGSAFGFPNPLLGLGGFVAPIAVGVGMIAGARFARWYWIAFNLGIAGALAFVIWLIGQSLYVLGTLCPWCMVVWSVTIPLFWAVTARNLAAGVFGSGLRGFGGGIRSWVIPLTIASYVTIAILAQFRLDLLAYLV